MKTSFCDSGIQLTHVVLSNFCSRVKSCSLLAGSPST